MTRRSVLYSSAYLTTGIFIYMMVLAYLTSTAISTGSPLPHLAAGLSIIPFGSELVIILLASLFILISLVLKVSSSKIEKNRLTAVVILNDLLITGFFVFASFGHIPAIIGGDILSHVHEAAVISVAAISLLLDLFSLPLERWGFTY